MDSNSDSTSENLYYLENFRTLASFVVNTYADVLKSEETSWYHRLCSASTPAQCLYIRLLMRKGSTFRVSKLKYAEIENTNSAIDELLDLELLDGYTPTNVEMLAGLFTVPELKSLAAADESTKTMNRVALLEWFISGQTQLSRSAVAQLQQADCYVSVNGHANWTLLQLCFFGNLYQDSSEFVLQQLGTLRYENYEISASARAFSDRLQVDKHLRYFECEAISAAIDNKDSEQILTLLEQLPASSKADSKLCRRLDRFRNRMARQLERLGESQAAYDQYQRSHSPPARERCVRILLSEKKTDLALTLCNEMLNEPANEAEWQCAVRLQRQCSIALGVKPLPQKRFKPQTDHLVLNDIGVRVEQAVQQFYQRSGQCFYVENSLFKGVLGLLIWDIIYAPIPGAFYNPFQAAPADFYEQSFRKTRADLLDSRLPLVANTEAFETHVLLEYNRHFGKLNPLVNWSWLSEPLLRLAIVRIPALHWRAVFNRLLLDFRENGNGFPDLVRFPDAGSYELIEVKGPGDQLQSNQRRWLQYFSSKEMPCRCVNVSWARTRAASTGKVLNDDDSLKVPTSKI